MSELQKLEIWREILNHKHRANRYHWMAFCMMWGEIGRLELVGCFQFELPSTIKDVIAS